MSTLPPPKPSNSLTACELSAIAWLNAQDLSGLSPEEVYDLYLDAWQRIRQHHRDILTGTDSSK